MTIAVDFDGTIVEHRYPGIGAPIPFAIETLLQLQKERHILILWSVREGRLLQEAVDYCASKGLVFYAANKNHPEEEVEKAPRKLMADLFIDDRNLGGLPDWGVIYQVIQSAAQGQDISYESMAKASAEKYVARKKKNFLIRLGEMFEK
ncbi:MAG: hypothetical protein QM654_13140 [Dysgonamonadaceae bacterium]